VAAVRGGLSLRAAARKFKVALAAVQYWVRRAEGQRLDRVDWEDRPPIPYHPRRTEPALEDLVLTVRRELQESSDLGFAGATAIQAALRQRGLASVPSVRTIGRILERRGALDGRKRQRRPPPPRGWHLPAVAQGRAELDSFDLVEGLVIKGGPQVEVLNGVSLQGGLAASWPREAPVTAKFVAAALVEHWRAWGLPGYAQFDNDTVFQGPHQHPDVLGRVTRLCLSLGVVPVFVPPRELGFQAMIEQYNGQWQSKVWARFLHETLSALQERSQRYVTALRRHRADRLEAAPGRRPFPPDWQLDLRARPHGRIVYLRRTNEGGVVELLGHHYLVDVHWVRRLVRAEADLDGGRIRFYSLRRREPGQQPLLKEIAYQLPNRRFRE
jgi:putative transposase